MDPIVPGRAMQSINSLNVAWDSKTGARRKTKRLAEADLAGRKPDRRATYGRLAEVERRPAATDAAADHDQAGFRSPDGGEFGFVGQQVPGRFQPSGIRLRQNFHDVAAPCLLTGDLTAQSFKGH